LPNEARRALGAQPDPFGLWLSQCKKKAAAIVRSITARQMTSSAPPQREMPTTAAERAAAGKALRDHVPRSSHSAWVAPADRSDPVQVLNSQGRGRAAGLVARRNARLAESPFAFFRATPGVMAADLAQTPASGPRAQLCGDAHCLNFGTAAAPDRRLIFDVLDFDETAPGPWEWDVKRLAASLVLAARAIKIRGENAHSTVSAAVRAYRLKMLDLATKTVLEAWSGWVDATAGPAEPDHEARRRRKQIADAVHVHSMQALLDALTVWEGGARRFRVPETLEPAAAEFGGGLAVEDALQSFADRLAPENRVLFARYRLIDRAPGPAGSGALALMQADPDDVLILQLKEAAPSVLEPYAGASSFTNPAERIVHGQRLMQAASDPLLGWGGSWGGHDFSVRQFKAPKPALDLAALDGYGLRDYALLCGSALAGAHARSADAAQIAGYLGKGDTFDKAVMRFGLLYAAQAEQDHASFLAAIDAGTVPVG
jgi:uncharacterized protein (DUF2252 family)